MEGESDKTISGLKAFKTNGKRWIIDINMHHLTEAGIFHFLISIHTIIRQWPVEEKKQIE